MFKSAQNSIKEVKNFNSKSRSIVGYVVVKHELIITENIDLLEGSFEDVKVYVGCVLPVRNKGIRNKSLWVDIPHKTKVRITQSRVTSKLRYDELVARGYIYDKVYSSSELLGAGFTPSAMSKWYSNYKVVSNY